MDRRQLLGIAATAGLGGCLRLSSSGTPTDSGTGPATDRASTTGATTPIGSGAASPDQPSTEARTTTGAVTYPIGLSESGVTSPGFLFNANVEALRQTSFRARWAKLDRTAGHVKWQKEYRGDGDVALGRWTGLSGGELTMYRYPGGNYWREDVGDRFTYGDEGPDNQGYEPAVWGIELNPLLRVGDWSAPRRVDDGRPTIWELTTDTVASGTPVPGYHLGEVIAIESASLRIDERGVIRSAEAAYVIRERDGEEIAYEIDYRLDSLGEITVSEPEWLPTAKEQAPTPSAGLTADRRAIELAIESGNRLESGSIVFVGAQDDRGFFLRLEEPLEPGITAFLSKPTSSAEFAPASGEISRGTPPSDDDEVVELTSEYSLGARRQATHYFEMVPVEA